ncbi:MAG: alpha/beta fold hydrolase [Bacteroidetes Order II. Incertae sedis bacterium]|nr:alpha/beta fold hydrolase [Bacteroidetes Order II. bacterium]
MKLKTFLFLLLLTNSTFGQKAKVEFLPDLPYDKYELKTGKDTINFYLSVSSKKGNLPLLVFIQGSGMNSLFTKSQNGQIRPEYGHMAWFDVAKEEYRVLIVDKPGVKYLQTGESKLFDSKFSLENWSNAIVNAINYISKFEKIDTNKIFVVGHSEGGIVASRVANMMKNRISKIAIMAGEGPSQLYSLYKFADDGTFFNTKEHNMPTSEERIRYLTNTWKDILAEPKSITKKFWGFTYLRWSSMLKTSVIEELTNFNGKILLLQGTLDKNVYQETATIAYTTLLTKGKNVKLELIENADHSFNILDKPEVNGWKMVLEKTIQWFNE